MCGNPAHRPALMPVTARPKKQLRPKVKTASAVQKAGTVTRLPTLLTAQAKLSPMP